MYSLSLQRSLKDESSEKINTAKKLMKEIVGYSDEEFSILKNELHFYLDFAENLTLEEAYEVAKPFWENGIVVKLYEGTKLILWPDTPMGLPKKEPPKEHYYDSPIIRPDQKINPRRHLVEIQKRREQHSKPSIKCPYCQSTNTKKLDVIDRGLSFSFFGFASSKVGKQWHCNSCKSDF